jgi:hypothetical protein
MTFLYKDERFQIDLLDGEPHTSLEDLIISMGMRVSIEIKESTIPFTLEVDLETADLELTMLGGHVKAGMEEWCHQWVKGANEVALYGFYWKIQNSEFLVLRNVFSMISSMNEDEFVDTAMDLIDYGSEMVYYVHRSDE